MSDLPEVVGDPAGMRALASTLRGLAGQAGGEGSAVSGKASAATWDGPAASEFRTTVALWDAQVRAAAGELVEAAAMLDASASRVEAEQIARARYERQLEEERLRAR